MLSPYIKLHKNCFLCQKLKAEKQDPDFLFETRHHLCFKSPFSEKWPGALMAVFKKHLFEQSEIQPPDLPDTFQSLVSYERALRATTQCVRINFVKFGNITAHLHWHLIPRSSEEIYLEKSPWELLNYSKKELYKENSKNKKTNKTLAKKNEITLFAQITKNVLLEMESQISPYFGCGLFVRHEKNPEIIFKLSLDEILKKIRSEPSAWQCLLMQRKYFDFAWDFIGGNAEPNEFPYQTMKREIKEELGWKIIQYQEVCRQWRRSGIKGFVYLAIPENKNYIEDSPLRTPCDEVKTVKYFSFTDILNNPIFAENVKGRVKTILSGETDFYCTD